MMPLEEVKENIERIAWEYRYLFSYSSAAGVVPVSLAWELFKEIEERENKIVELQRGNKN